MDAAVDKPQLHSRSSLVAASLRLQCDLATIMAVSTVEAGPYGAFLPTGEPVVLFEPHWFSRLTGGRHDWKKVPVSVGLHDPLTARWRVISRPQWTPGTYGPVSVQHRRLSYAATLDRDAALKSASWGLYQVLGVNHVRAGHPTIQSFVNAAYRDVDAHLDMFVSYVLSDPRLAVAIRHRDWKTVTKLYNGTGQVDYYASRLDKAYTAAVATSTSATDSQFA